MIPGATAGYGKHLVEAPEASAALTIEHSTADSPFFEIEGIYGRAAARHACAGIRDQPETKKTNSMNIVRIDKGELDFGGGPIFDGIDFLLRTGGRIGLVGANGSGKTTLLRVINGDVTLDRGQLSLGRDVRFGYLPQGEPETFSAEPLFERVLSGDVELRDMSRTLERIEKGEELDAEKLDRHESIRELFAHRGGYTMEGRAERLLTGLGFKKREFGMPVRNLSGGWRMRAELARILFSEPDALLLDEPTNHLDLDALLYLERYLLSFGGGVALVSHDRDFLDNVATSVYELEQHGIRLFHGNYSNYEREKKKAVELQWKAYDAQQEEIERVTRFISRFKARKDMAPMVKSRVRFLEKLERLKPPATVRSVNFNFPPPRRSGRVVMQLDGIVKSYGENEVLRGIDLTLERGDRLALTGPNGTGKSTLSRIIAGDETPDKGEVTRGYHVTPGFFVQEQAELLVSDQTVLQELQAATSTFTVFELRSLLGAFLFSGDDVNKRVKVLSGGEKCRLSLARLLLRQNNFYILDEPTNHLDIFSKDVLINALENFGGTYIIVSHDRYVLDRVCNKVAEIVDGRLVVYPGTYSEYIEMKKRRLDEDEKKAHEAAEGSRSGAPNSSSPPGRSHGRRAGRQESKAAKRRRKAEIRTARNELAEIEKEIARREEDQERIDSALCDPDLFKTEGLAAKFAGDRERTVKKLMNLYEKWSTLAEKIEEVGTGNGEG